MLIFHFKKMSIFANQLLEILVSSFLPFNFIFRIRQRINFILRNERRRTHVGENRGSNFRTIGSQVLNKDENEKRSVSR